RSGSVSGHGDHRHATANPLGYRRPPAIVLALQPVVLDRDILAIDITNFPKTCAESGRITRESIGRSHDESNNRQCRLLRACRQRPKERRSRRAPEPRDEIPPPHRSFSSRPIGSLSRTRFCGNGPTSGAECPQLARPGQLSHLSNPAAFWGAPVALAKRLARPPVTRKSL